MRIRTSALLRSATIAWLLAVPLGPVPAGAQGGSRPIPCPQILTLNFLGVMTFRHAGHAWDTNWSLRMEVKTGQGYYVPPGQPLRIYSTNRQAVWKNPGIIVACREYSVDLYFLQVRVEYWVEQFLGQVEELGDCGTGGDGGARRAELESVMDEGYDPYDPMGGEQTACGGGEDFGTGNLFRPGDYTGGETVDWQTGAGNGGVSACGATAKVEFICIDVWNPETGEWDRLSCGYVTTC